jgi:hypothetical protein
MNARKGYPQTAMREAADQQAENELETWERTWEGAPWADAFVTYVSYDNIQELEPGQP